ncbi:hypothetical protein AB4Y96_02950 [Phyllobacterium sp. TAF24]|uniref:hypothetical protein n=1 Tax=unclassified Phyllobacterium TaxID=2638441 RepID=UPI0008845D2A|nr:hypothetical protein [Phyllobacterium sp. OV277]SDO67880.1 hypothetical protein SAMN05443582_102781 [Phyllobacterium sp. OV277]
MAANDKERQTVTESKRILERISRETNPGGKSAVERTVNRTKGHFTAEDADAADPIEIWGTRIGRVLGLLVLIAMFIWLISSITGKS